MKWSKHWDAVLEIRLVHAMRYQHVRIWMVEEKGGELILKFRNTWIHRVHRAENTWEVRNEDRGCVSVWCKLRNEYFCRWYLRKRGFVSFRILNFICHISEDNFWCPFKSQNVYKGRIIKLVKQIVIQGTLKS